MPNLPIVLVTASLEAYHFLAYSWNGMLLHSYAGPLETVLQETQISVYWPSSGLKADLNLC